MAWFRAKKDKCTEQTSHSKLQMSIKGAFTCVSGPGPLTTENNTAQRHGHVLVAERSSALDSSSGVVRMWVQIPAWPVTALVSLSKTLNHNCFVLRMGRKAVGPVCCVRHINEPRTLIVKEKGLAPMFLDSRFEHPAGWICARYKSSEFCIIFFIFLFF